MLLQDVQLRDYKAHLADRVPQHEVAVDVGPLNLDLKNFDSLGDKPFDLRLDTGLGKQGKLQATGNVQLSPTSAQLKVATQDIDLRLAQAYLSPFIRLELRSGLLGSDLDVQLRSTEPLALSVTGSAHVDQLHTLDTLRERDFLRWKQVRVGGLDYRHGESLAIERVELDQPYARFVINENLTTNVSELIVPQPAAPNESKVDAGKPLAIRIGGVTINDGSANFADFSLTPSFATAVQQMNGRIGVLDNQKPQAASVDIQGKVDRYAPMSIKGKLTPFDPLNSLDIATSFKNVELTTITPTPASSPVIASARAASTSTCTTASRRASSMPRTRCWWRTCNWASASTAPTPWTCRFAWQSPCSRTPRGVSPSSCRYRVI